MPLLTSGFGFVPALWAVDHAAGVRWWPGHGEEGFLDQVDVAGRLEELAQLRTSTGSLSCRRQRGLCRLVIFVGEESQPLAYCHPGWPTLSDPAARKPQA